MFGLPRNVVAYESASDSAYRAQIEREGIERAAQEQLALGLTAQQQFDQYQLDAPAREAARRARAQERASRSAARQGHQAVAPPADIGGDVWAALARCESGGNPRAIGGGGRYFGAFQFSLGTWRSVGGTGNPIDHPYETQLAFAKKLQARSGWGQWPHCSRKLGLR
ncbi:MAG TPA: transglycosylase family protein [Nitrososphaera sp.]|nr:transglycosylase family protein [Nitrososphaera sp.]